MYPVRHWQFLANAKIDSGTVHIIVVYTIRLLVVCKMWRGAENGLYAIFKAHRSYHEQGLGLALGPSQNYAN